MRRLLSLASLLLTVAACTSHGPVLAPHLPAGSGGPPLELEGTAFFAQSAYHCGPAALATVLNASGVDAAPQSLVSQVYLPARRGSLQVEIVATARRYERVPYVIAPDLLSLIAELEAGRPVLVLQNLGLDIYPVWHYAVVIGYVPSADAIILRSGKQKRLLTPAGRFQRTWAGAEHWGLVLLRPGEMPARPAREAYLNSVAPMEGIARPEALLRAYSAARQRWPNSRVARFGEANALHALGRLDAAERAYRQILARHPRDGAVRNNLAVVLAARGCYAAALNLVEAALADQTQHDQLRAALLQTRSEIRLGERSAECRTNDQAAIVRR